MKSFIAAILIAGPMSLVANAKSLRKCVSDQINQEGHSYERAIKICQNADSSCVGFQINRQGHSYSLANKICKNKNSSCVSFQVNYEGHSYDEANQICGLR